MILWMTLKVRIYSFLGLSLTRFYRNIDETARVRALSIHVYTTVCVLCTLTTKILRIYLHVHRLKTATREHSQKVNIAL